jgi:hypothetical protein
MLTNQQLEGFSPAKLPWSAPELTELKSDLIRQQEEELLYYLMNSEEFFRLVNGTASDYRLKEDKRDFDALSVVEAISAYDFAWKTTGEREYGFMAHEIQQVMPYLVSGQKDQVDEHGQPIVQRVNYAKLAPVLIKAIQQQQQMIESLQQQLQEITAGHLAK